MEEPPIRGTSIQIQSLALREYLVADTVMSLELCIMFNCGKDAPKRVESLFTNVISLLPLPKKRVRPGRHYTIEHGGADVKIVTFRVTC